MYSPSVAKVVLFGAGGQVGKHVLEALLANPKFTVTILAQKASASKYPPGVSVIRTDFAHEALVAALRGQDAVVSTVSHMALDRQESVMKAALSAGVRRFLPTEYGGDTANDELIRLAPFTIVKRRVSDELRKLEGHGPTGDFSWTSIVTGPFLEWVLQSGEFGFDLEAHTATLYDDGNIPFALTKLTTVGDAVAGVLLNLDATKNRRVYIRSALATHRKLLHALEEVTTSSWMVQSVGVTDLRKGGLGRIEAGDFMGNLDLIRAAILTKGTGFDYTPMNESLGVQGDVPIMHLVREHLGVKLFPLSNEENSV